MTRFTKSTILLSTGILFGALLSPISTAVHASDKGVIAAGSLDDMLNSVSPNTDTDIPAESESNTNIPDGVYYGSNNDLLIELKSQGVDIDSIFSEQELQELEYMDQSRSGSNKVVRKNGRTYIYVNSIIAGAMYYGRIGVTLIAASLVE